WDEIHFIDGYPGEFCCLARRKGDNWYVAAINASEARSVTIDFDFIGSVNYSGKAYKDNGHDGVVIEEIILTRDSSLLMNLPENGGFVIQLKEK
ncbi:MAG: glycoside hydrolase family 97 C-terminal domain-containing protein, partial [Bacteroidota bacterium]